MPPFATVNDIISLFRPLTSDEQARAQELLPVVSDRLRQEAVNRHRNLDKMILSGIVLESVVKSVTVDIVARVLMTSTSQEPVSQLTQSAGGYSATATFLSPGGGIFIKNSELSAIGLNRQRFGGVETWH